MAFPDIKKQEKQIKMDLNEVTPERVENPKQIYDLNSGINVIDFTGGNTNSISRAGSMRYYKVGKKSAKIMEMNETIMSHASRQLMVPSNF